MIVLIPSNKLKKEILGLDSRIGSQLTYFFIYDSINKRMPIAYQNV